MRAVRLLALSALVASIIAGIPGVARAGHGAADSSANASSLVLNCTTEGADVFIDNNKVGVTPLPPQLLPPGEHTIKVNKLGYAPIIDVFTINKKKPSKMDVELVPVAGVLSVTSNVAHSNVFVDGKFLGEAPLSVEIAVGDRAIQVSKGGYKDFFQNLSAVGGQATSIEATLEELPEGLNPYKLPPPPPPKWYEKKWVWGVVAAGAVVVVVAIVVPLEVKPDPIKDFGPTYTFTIGGAK